VQRYDHKIACRSARCDERKKLRCRNATHSGIFHPDQLLNKIKKANPISPDHVTIDYIAPSYPTLLNGTHIFNPLTRAIAAWAGT